MRIDVNPGAAHFRVHLIGQAGDRQAAGDRNYRKQSPL
jgi:hypothetical protein